MVSRHFEKHRGNIPCVKTDGKRCKTAIGNGKYKVKDHHTVIAEPSGKPKNSYFLHKSSFWVFCLK